MWNKISIAKNKQTTQLISLKIESKQHFGFKLVTRTSSDGDHITK